MKPTSPQPPGLTDEEAFDIWLKNGRTVKEAITGPIHAAFAAGCEAQRKVDARNRIYEKCLDEMHAENDGEICSKCLMSAIRIERTPEQPTTQRCPTCESPRPDRRYGIRPNGLDYPCDNERFHSQPTTGEAGK